MRTFKVFFEVPDPEWIEIPDDVTDDALDDWIIYNVPTPNAFVETLVEWVESE